MILSKSNHPVNIKIINVRVWSLRSEIEAAIKTISHPAGTTEYQNALEAIADFYRLSSQAQTAQKAKDNNAKPALTLVETPAEEVDEDMAAMMEALGTPEKAETTTAEADAAAAAAEMLSGQTSEATTEGSEAIAKVEQPKISNRTIPAAESLSHGNLLLSDINMDMALVFSKHPFTIGQSVAIEFLIPKNFILSAEIDYCQSIIFKSKVISDKKPEYRIRLRFKHVYPGERTNLRNFLKSIEPDISVKNKPASKAESSGSENSQDDIDASLAELGL
jgi:hypothetical protein